jgi:xylulokinase
MADRLLLGIDLGTSSAKAGLFRTAGQRVASAEVPYHYRVPHSGWAEMDAEIWWDVTCRLIGAVLAEAGARPEWIAGIGISGQAPTLLPVDAAGHPLGPAILWLDTRSEIEAQEIVNHLGRDVCERVGGNRVHPYFLGPKLRWLMRHNQEVFDRTWKIFQSQSYPVWKLTGEAVTDFSTAALCAPLYDARSRSWSVATCEALGIATDILPPIRPAHTVAGTVTQAAAEVTGLCTGTPVAVGGGDFACSTLGAGVLEEGEACLMLGTAGNLQMPLRNPRFDSRMINSHHVGCDRFLTLGGVLSGGVLEWCRKTFGSGETSFDRLEAEALVVPSGAGGVIFLPHLQGTRTPTWSARARGVLFGLGLQHGRGHLYRAALEGVGFSLRHCLFVVEEQGLRLTEVVAVNGGARSPLLRQVLSDILGVPLLYAPNNGGAPGGAAILAGLAAGVLDSAEVSRVWRQGTIRHDPDPATHRRYEDLFRIYVRLFEDLEGDFGRVQRWP